MRVAAVELPDGLSGDSAAFAGFARRLDPLGIDLLILNELPFGSWPAGVARYDPARAAHFVRQSARWGAALAALPVGAVLSTRPRLGPSRIVNEAVLLRDGTATALREKQIFPQEPGYYECDWFEFTQPGGDLADIGGIACGALVCTELMFTELARDLGRRGAHVIAVPRATGEIESWVIAARMAALSSGCYVVSSNRRSAASGGQAFGGAGMIVAPGGELLGMTTADAPILSAEIDLARVQAAQRAYPCYVRRSDPLRPEAAPAVAAIASVPAPPSCPAQKR